MSIVIPHHSSQSLRLHESGMDIYAQNPRRRLHDRVFLWDRKFAERQRRAYRAEDSKLVPTDGQTMVDAFLGIQNSRLDPPQFSYNALRKFLESADEVPWDNISAPSPQDAPLTLLDDRRDDTGWQDINGTQHSARNWDGYSDYPPRGESRISGLFNPEDLYRKLLRSVGVLSSASIWRFHY